MMSKDNLITHKAQFITTATDSLNTLFREALADGQKGEIEIRTFTKEKRAIQSFHSTADSAAEKAYELCNQGVDVYFGVNPRIGKGGRKENVEWVVTFHAEVDYGIDGHKKTPLYADYDEALAAINRSDYQPTLIIHSGGGFHCYWVLSSPIDVKNIGVASIEGINKALSTLLGGDRGTQDISRILRIPGTFNFKLPDNPRPVTLVVNSGRTYNMDDFKDLTVPDVKPIELPVEVKSLPDAKMIEIGVIPADIDRLPVSERIKNLIRYGNDGTYASRSDADFAVILALTNCGRAEGEIKRIFLIHKVGEKYRHHPAPDQYLKHNIEKAKDFSNLSPEEKENPLFVSGSIHKTENGYQLRALRFQEYMVAKYKIKILDKEKAFFRYNGKCYEEFTEDYLNHFCQTELGRYREVFSASSLKTFIHYAVGNAFIQSDKARVDQLNYLTLGNGLYSLDRGMLIPHTPDIFTTNLLPYDYDPDARCPRFIQFLEEIFLGDRGKICFIQEAVGYAFHKSMPTPSIFFLIGCGSNGKSVFINTIANLVGKDNTCSISFSDLADEYYVLELFQKMINISGETPVKNMKTDRIKLVTAGDLVTGRRLYRQPMQFRPFAKHFLAMNEPPDIKDKSHGMWRRIYPIEFPRVFTEKEMDRQLEGKLLLELSGIFNWALEGYRRLRERNFALIQLESMHSAKQDYRKEVDSVRAFVHERLTKSDNANDRLKYGELYERYTQYCQTEGRRDIEEKPRFRKVMKELGFRIESSKKDANQVFVFNVRDVNDADDI